MITITPAAAAQIRAAAKQGRMEGMALRIAAQRNADGQIQYAMGFDDSTRSDDTRFSSEGVELVVAATSTMLLEGTTLDFVELEPGRSEFIFMNPNDPNYRPPQEADA
ncbi:MAG: HesB/IscA family protein [Gammaproteobacteria bacterium]